MMEGLRLSDVSGRLPAAPDPERQVVAEGRWPAVAFFTATQDIRSGTVWTLERGVDTVIVHLGGPILQLETELEGCGAVHDPPMAGEVWIVPAGQRYRTQARGGLVHYAEIHLDPGEVDRLAGSRWSGQPVRARAGHFDGFLHRSVLRLEALVQERDDMSLLAAESLGHTLLLDFYCRYRSSSAQRMNRRGVRLDSGERRQLEAFVGDNLGSPLRLETMAAAVHMTAHEFLIAFRAEFGTTPAQYVIDQRLRRARWLLLNTKATVAEIAFETGFSSHAHLTSCFRQRLQTTPRQFRSDSRHAP
ncbi:MAG: AraC family transcriptional regulator [Bryobacteraceae bacterium]